MYIQIQTKHRGLWTIEIDDNLFTIFREDFMSFDDAISELMATHAGTIVDPSDLPDMVNSFMVGWCKSAVRRQRGL